MVTPRALVLRAAGTNSDAETAHAFERCGALTTTLPLQPFLENPDQLESYQILAIPGGFSYGDDIFAGRVFATEMVHRAGGQILDLVKRGGVVLGICNGFQVLVQMGLLPGLEEPLGLVEATLADNDVNVYQDRWVHLAPRSSSCVFLEADRPLYLPVAHAEGKLIPRNEEVRRRLHQDHRVALCYVDADGGREPAFPANPNGSTDHIAGLTDRTGRIFGLMPHPERHQFPFQHPTWTRQGPTETPDGLHIFQNGVNAVR